MLCPSVLYHKGRPGDAHTFLKLQSKEAYPLGFQKRSKASFLKVITNTSALVSLEMQTPAEGIQ